MDTLILETRGRPEFEPSPQQRLLVQLMVASCFTQDKIAEHVGVDAKTLRKHFRKELKNGKAYVLALVAQSIYKKALGDGDKALTAAFFVMKTQGGWRETDRLELEHMGKDGGPIQYEGARERNIEVIEQLSARVASATTGPPAKRAEDGGVPEAEPATDP
jgi:predicted transcriptional regulator